MVSHELIGRRFSDTSALRGRNRNERTLRLLILAPIALLAFFWFIRLERTFDKMKGHEVHQVFTPMKTKRMNRHVHELFVPCVRAAWL